MLFYSINGKPEATISVIDRGLNYGDGLFTTAKVCQGKIDYFEQHLERLKNGCDKLFIENVDFIWLENYLCTLVSEYPLAVLKVLITAGAGGRGYSRQGAEQANVVVSIHPFPEQYHLLATQGINLGVANTMLGVNPQLAGIKHLNRLEQVLVRKELDGRAEDDLLVLNIHQDVIETSSANIFYQIEQKWYTPAITISGVDGIMRQAILTKAEDVTVCKDNLTALADVSAMFICNSIAGIIPVNHFNNTTLDMQAVASFKDKISC
ncbi:MAG: aminodeoxychorismate lyase [Thalassotalea sp.]